MPFADKAGGIACIPGDGAERHIVRSDRILLEGIPDTPRLGRPVIVITGHESIPARRAQRRRGMRIGKPHTFIGQRIQVRSGRQRLRTRAFHMLSANIAETHVIRNNHHDVRQLSMTQRTER